MISALVADAARCRILLALDDGRGLPASRLAAEAGVSPATASSHLGKLTEGGLLAVEAPERHRHYRLAGPADAQLIEARQELAPAMPIRSLRQQTRVQGLREALRVPNNHPPRSGSMLVLMEGAAESVSSTDVEPGDLCRVGDRTGERMKRGCTVESSVRPVPVVERLELPQGVQEVALIPDQGAV